MALIGADVPAVSSEYLRSLADEQGPGRFVLDVDYSLVVEANMCADVSVDDMWAGV